MRTLAEIFIKASPPEIPLRVTVREIVQEKPKYMKQQKSQLKSASQATISTNSEPIRVPIVETYSEELQLVNPAKNPVVF